MIAEAANKRRVVAFVDGFNLYHAIDDLDRNPLTRKPTYRKQHLKWLDLWALAEAFIAPSREVLVAVHYFSAYADWIPDAHQRHRAFVAAIEARGVTVKMGNFKKKSRGCPKCNHQWIGHEEKESDVNIALSMLDLAQRDVYDRALLITADTDLVPAVRLVRERYPERKVDALIPEQRFRYAMELRQACNNASRISEGHIERNLLPETIALPSGKVIQRPQKYTPPKPKKP